VSPYQAYVTNAIDSLCVWMITAGQYSNIMTFYALKASVIPHLMTIYRQLLWEQRLLFMPKKR